LSSKQVNAFSLAEIQTNYYRLSYFGDQFSSRLADDDFWAEGLSQAPRAMIIAGWVQGVVGNGGLRYYYEHSVDPAVAAWAFRYLGFEAAAEAVEHSAQSFPPGMATGGWDVRDAWVGEHSEELAEAWEEADCVIMDLATPSAEGPADIMDVRFRYFILDHLKEFELHLSEKEAAICQDIMQRRRHSSSVMPAIHQAAFSGDISAVQAMIQAGDGVNCSNPMGYTPLMTAMHEGWLDIVRLLLSAGADVHARTVWGQTLMHMACYKSPDRKLTTMISEHNGLLKSLGRTAYDELRADINIEGLRILLDAGVDLNAADAAGYTPLMAAAEAGWLNKATFLVQYGAYTGAATLKGQSAKDLAKTRNDDDMVEFLTTAD